MDVVIFANSLNAFGVFFGLTAHSFISLSKNEKVGHGFYVISCILIIIGSILLSSWPIVATNAGWMIIAIFGLTSLRLNFSVDFMKTFPFLLKLSLLFGVVSLFLGDYDLAGFAVTAIYIIAYSLLVSGRFTNINYVWWCSVSFLMLIPHLLSADQYSILVGESIGFAIGIVGLYKFYCVSKEA
jgi:hypothetical protein